MTASMVLRVRNIQCEGCASQVRRTLEALEGVEEVNAVGLGEGAVELELDATLRFGALAIGVLVVGLLGYVGYELYPRFDMPAVHGFALLAMAVGAGVASFFSPCAFSLLLTIVGRQVSSDDGEESRDGEGGGRITRPFRFATAMSLGASAFVLLLGAVMALGGRALVGDVVFTSAEGRILRAGVGLSLVALGLVQVGLLPNPLHAVEEAVQPLIRFQAEQRRERPFVGSTVFGFGYLLAGFG